MYASLTNPKSFPSIGRGVRADAFTLMSRTVVLALDDPGDVRLITQSPAAVDFYITLWWRSINAVHM